MPGSAMKCPPMRPCSPKRRVRAPCCSTAPTCAQDRSKACWISMSCFRVRRQSESGRASATANGNMAGRYCAPRSRPCRSNNLPRPPAARAVTPRSGPASSSRVRWCLPGTEMRAARFWMPSRQRRRRPRVLRPRWDRRKAGRKISGALFSRQPTGQSSASKSRAARIQSCR